MILTFAFQFCRLKAQFKQKTNSTNDKTSTSTLTKHLESTKKQLNRTSEIGYGYYWQQTSIQFKNEKRKTIFGWGDGGQFLFIFPEINTVIVSNAGNYGEGEDSVIFEMLKNYILPAIAN